MTTNGNDAAADARCECGSSALHGDSCPSQFGTCGDCPVCGSLSPWRCGHWDSDGNLMDENDEKEDEDEP